MASTSIKALPPPSPQEVHRKLSVHAKPKVGSAQALSGMQKSNVSPGAMSGTESDSDSQLAASEVGSPHGHGHGHGHGSGGASLYASGSQHPLQSIAERRPGSGDESDEDEDEEGEWRMADKGKGRDDEESAVKSGYLWKKGSRRKVRSRPSFPPTSSDGSTLQTWKKRWFVLRSPHLAYYKTSAEYQLLRLLDLNEVHSVTPVLLKKHANTFGLVLPTRTFYLQAESEEQVAAWVRALNGVRERLQTTSSITPVPTPPVAIPGRAPDSAGAAAPATAPAASSPPNVAITSSDEEEASPHTYVPSSPGAARQLAPAKGLGTPVANDPTKVVLSGYLMKCGKRKSWRKRWFVLTGEKLVYCGNHMVRCAPWAAAH